jgi:SAM-dependent methyltransferase
MSVPEWLSSPRTWNRVAPGYAAEIVPVFSTFADDAIGFAQLAPGERVLDVATGPGTLALAARRAGARVTAIDFSPQMIAELDARARAAGVSDMDVRVADARALPFEASGFDAVFSMFALNLVADRGAAFEEIRRVVKRGGRAVVGTPASLRKKPAYDEVRDIVCRALPEVDLDLDLPLGEPSELARELAAAGFDEVVTRTSTRPVRFSTIQALWAMASRAAAPVVMARDATPADRWARASAEVVRGLEERFGPGPHEIDLVVNLALGRA